MKINQEIVYFINYKPLLNFRKEVKNINLIYCKNFFLFFLLIENMIIKNNNNISLSIKKKNKYFKSFLRAPNKYKKAQVKVELVRYEIKFKFYYNYNLNFVQNLNIQNLIYFINFYFNFTLFLESTLFFLKKKKIKILLNPVFYKTKLLEL